MNQSQKAAYRLQLAERLAPFGFQFDQRATTKNVEHVARSFGITIQFHDWKPGTNDGVFHCTRCKTWTANLPLYRFDLCPQVPSLPN